MVGNISMIEERESVPGVFLDLDTSENLEQGTDEKETKSGEMQEKTRTRLLFAGDICIQDYIAGYYDNAGIGGIVSDKLREQMLAADIMMANQEFAFSERGKPMEDKQYTYEIAPHYVSIFTDLGIDIVTLANGVGSNSYAIVGSFKSRATDVEAVIPSAYAVLDFGASNYNFLAYTAADPDSIMVQIRDLFGSMQNWSRTVEEFNTDAISTVGAFLKPMHSMTYFILLLAAVGIVNNLLINYMQKRRTIAMYKSVGLSNRQNIKMTLIESFTSGMIGAFVAVTVSYLEIQTIFLVAGSKISMLPELDFKVFLSAGAMGVLITLIGSVVPIIKSRKMKLVEEIKFE